MRIYSFQMYFCFTAFPRSLRQIWHIYYFVVEAVFFQLISVGIMYYQPPCLNSLYQLASCVISHPVSTADISQHHMLSATLSQQLISVGIMCYQPPCLNSWYQSASYVISHPVSTADISRQHVLSATLSQLFQALHRLLFCDLQDFLRSWRHIPISRWHTNARLS